jgi:NADH-quinone oxidoreductase subunit J
MIGVFWARNLGVDATLGAPPLPEDYSNTRALGEVLYTQYVYPFELAAVLLLVAIVAAITLTLRQRPGLKPQDVAKQVAVRREDRVRLVTGVDAAGTGPGADRDASPRGGEGA